MAKLTPYFGQKENIQMTINRATTQEELEAGIRKITNSKELKLYTARYLDGEIKKIDKTIKHMDFKAKERQRLEQEALKNDNWYAKLNYGLNAFQKLNVDRYNSIAKQISPQLGTMRTEKEYYEEVLQNKKNTLNDGLTRCEIARKAIQLNAEEQNALYPTLSSLYQDQVNERKWYQHGAVAIIAAIILFPLSPLIYYLWKNDRDEELLQPNALLSLNEEERASIRENRKVFKENANFTVSHEEKEARPIPEFVTKYKNERNQFFSTNRFFASVNDIKWVNDNKSVEDEERLLLGMR